MALDNNEYKDSDLISIKIPVSYLPYYNNSSTFERIDGQVEIQGLQYNYVKRRIYNDSLELLCIPNQAAMNYKAVNDEFFRFLYDLQHMGKGRPNHSRHHASKRPSGDYCSPIYCRNQDEIFLTLPQKLSFYLFRIASRHHFVPEQPPENA
jgi:hypothetical protein